MAGPKDSDDQNDTDSGNDTGKYDTDDAARDTDVPEKEVADAWHTAKDDYEETYNVADRHSDKSDWDDHWGIEHDDGSE